MPGLPQSNLSNSQTFSFDCQEIVHTVEFCPFENSSNLIAYGGESRVSVGVGLFGHDADNDQGFQFNHVADFHHGTRVQAIAWSPKTSINTVPPSIQFCTIGGDKKLRYYLTMGKQENTSVKTLSGHTAYINACAFEPIVGDLVASVSDDLTCRLWDLETGAQTSCIPLGSPGMAVKWNSQDPNKLMVAEKNGIIRFYDLVNQQAIMSVFVGRVPLIDADWCQTDPLKVGAVALDDWYIWDMSKSSLPEIICQAHPDGICKFRWANSHKSLFATSGRPGNQVKVYHIGHQKLPVSCDLKVGGGLSWHYSLPLCASGDDMKVQMWAVEV